jgi:hypothetical protein
LIPGFKTKQAAQFKMAALTYSTLFVENRTFHRVTASNSASIGIPDGDWIVTALTTPHYLDFIQNVWLASMAAARKSLTLTLSKSEEAVWIVLSQVFRFWVPSCTPSLVPQVGPQSVRNLLQPAHLAPIHSHNTQQLSPHEHTRPSFGNPCVQKLELVQILKTSNSNALHMTGRDLPRNNIVTWDSKAKTPVLKMD